MTCKDCLENTGSYSMSCIGCTARWILQFDKQYRLAKIESNGRHDVEMLKQEVINRAKGKA